MSQLPPDKLPTGTRNTAVSPDHFSTEHLKADLRGRSIRGGMLTIASQGACFVLNIGSTVILARLLTPGDFGLIAMVAPITGFVALFRDLGLSMATIQRDKINHDQVSTLFWVNVAVSLVLMGIAMAIAPAVGWFYNDPRTVWIAMVSATTFMFGGLTVQHGALLQRQMRFKVLAVIRVASQAMGVATALIAALLGFSYWSIVFSGIAAAFTNAALAWIYTGWIPGKPKKSVGVRELLRFGGNLTGFRFMNYISRQFDKVYLGRFWGEATLGIYNKAYGLLLLPINQINGPITNVALPALSRLQNEPDRYRHYFRRSIRLITMIGMPIVAFSFVAADDIINLFLGAQWTGAIRIFRAFGPLAFLGTFNVAAGWVYISLGRTERQLRWEMLNFAGTIYVVLMTISYGALGVALGLSAFRVCIQIPSLKYCYSGTPITLSDLFRAISRPFASSLFAGAVCWAMAWYVFPTGLPLVISLLVQFLFFSTAFAVSWVAVPGGYRDFRATADLFTEQIVRRGRR